ncbi:hypothetical protein [Streptomyces sp. 891-h]|uniref:hypothetical protein n=1 Tax=unclassified Streptomyces TaxID=2593676 RepID=UPI001FA99BFD|nr:hypothetical protein [Streptomyces sp. 891-h]UNZ16689.1 hypothetical protein HC362_06005 [Streptomyces sp. 891-h]
MRQFQRVNGHGEKSALVLAPPVTSATCSGNLIGFTTISLIACLPRKAMPSSMKTQAINQIEQIG